ncbi:hypothetical protein [Pseudomonas sp. UMAB-40]|uniref:hypothetical protein n=1 Tax=Pseudomonas sp. UMAB-40 TaxID=1365407 RepID=UPI001C59C4D1|nr:hypothetical protein [Pseudomonas sp. UMAB-40]
MATLPPIHEVKACPHCGNDDEFYVMQTYSGRGVYRRGFDGYVTDNTDMYDCLSAKVSKRAYCATCHKPVAQWDEEADSPHYGKQRYP